MERELTKTEKAYFDVAKSMSTLSDHPRAKLGAVVVSGHKIISSGYNSHVRCDTFQCRLDKKRFNDDSAMGKLHAEISALLPFIKDRRDVSGSVIYIYREHKDHTLAMAKPCPSCEAVIRAMGIKKVYYTVEGGFACEKIGGLYESRTTGF